MVKIGPYYIGRKPKEESKSELVQEKKNKWGILKGRSLFGKKESDKGQVNIGFAGRDHKLSHPANMDRYDALCNDPETRIGIDLLVDMIVGVQPYVEMPEEDFNGVAVDPEHANKKLCELWLKGKKSKIKEVVRTKFEKGFAPVEILEDMSFKVLPPETFYIYRNEKGTVEKYTQETGAVSSSPKGTWENAEDMKDIVLFFHNEGTSHPYGVSLVESIADLIDARKQINMDIPKIIHRYSAPKGIWESVKGVQELYELVTTADVDEDIFIPNVAEGELRHTFIEPQSTAKFIPYIEQIYFQIAEALHAPLILLLKNATEASATKMLESVDNFVQGEQHDMSEQIQSAFFARLCKPPIPLVKWGAPKAVFDNIDLEQIGSLQSNGTITWEQAQDLIRQKGIPLIEAEKPEPEPIADFNPENPMLAPAQVSQVNQSLETILEAFQNKTISATEAITEADRSINAYVKRAKAEAQRRLAQTLNKPVEQLPPETERDFKLIRNEIFDAFRKRLLPNTEGGSAGDEPTKYIVIPRRD